jgi:hypothetical protein
MTHIIPEDLPEDSYLAFVRNTDPNLFEWLQRSDEGHSLAWHAGQLSTAYTLLKDDRESPGLSLREGVARWLVGYHALRRRRDSFRFLHALDRERATNPETRVRPDVATLIDDIDRALDFIRVFVVEIQERLAAGDTFNDGEVDGIVSLYCALGAGNMRHDDEADDGPPEAA